MKLHLLPLLALSMLWACNDTKEQADNKENETPACTYSLNPDSVSITWTAYKTTERIGVSGTFNSLTITGATASENPAQVFTNAAFSIATDSVFSNNPERDMKIVKHFFGNLTEGTVLKGKVKTLPSATYGSGSMLLEINGIEKEVPFNFTAGSAEVNLSTDIDLAEWQATPAIDSLNQICYDLHKGADGVSKLWPNVKLELRVVLDQNCE